MMPLKIEHVKKRFGGIQALDGVSLTIAPGEFIGLIGPNGSGKSTLINCITGYYRPDSGSITLGGITLHDRPPEFVAKAGVARTFQVTKVFRRMTVRENLEVPLIAAEGRSWRASAHRVDRVLETLRLSRLAGEPASRLSGGQQRLLEFGMILMARPHVVLLDEPFSGVHPELRLQLEEILQALHREGKTILLVSHDMSSVFRLCQRIVVLDKGRVIADGAPELVRAMRSVHDAYLGA